VGPLREFVIFAATWTFPNVNYRCRQQSAGGRKTLTGPPRIRDNPELQPTAAYNHPPLAFDEPFRVLPQPQFTAQKFLEDTVLTYGSLLGTVIVQNQHFEFDFASFPGWGFFIPNPHHQSPTSNMQRNHFLRATMNSQWLVSRQMSVQR